MIRNLVYISGMVLLCGMLAGTHAAERSSTKEQLLSLEGLVQETVENNPEIQGAAQRLEAAKAVIPQVQTLPDAKINLEYRDLTEREAMYGVTQELLAVAIVVAIVYGASRWHVGTNALRAQLRATRVPITPATYALRELEGLPPPVQRYFRAVLTEGQPIVAAVRVAHAGQFNMSETHAKWSAFTSD